MLEQLARTLRLERVSLAEHRVSRARPAWRTVATWGADGPSHRPDKARGGPYPDGVLAALEQGQPCPFPIARPSGAPESPAVAVPVLSEGRLVAWILGEASPGRRRFSARERSVLALAASALAAAWPAFRCADTADRAPPPGEPRHAGVERAAEALGKAATALFEARDPEAFVRQGLAQMQEVARCEVLYAFRADGEGTLRLAMARQGRRWSASGFRDDPPHFRQGFQLRQALVAGGRGRSIWFEIDPDRVPGRIHEPTHAWHVRMGHRSVILTPLLAGRRVVGLLGMCFADSRQPPPATLELIRLLALPVAAAFEMVHLSQLAQVGAARSAALSERARIARDIHDGIAQSFLAIQMQLDAAPGTPDGSAVRRAADLAQQGLREARRAVSALRPSTGVAFDLPEALRDHLGQYAGAGVRTVFELPGRWVARPMEVEEQVFRIVQEALQNAFKHARATEIRVEMAQSAGAASVRVVDDGIGFAVPPVAGEGSGTGTGTGFGLESMRQRAALIGATLRIRSLPGHGAEVLLRLPPSPPPARGRVLRERLPSGGDRVAPA